MMIGIDRAAMERMTAVATDSGGATTAPPPALRAALAERPAPSSPASPSAGAGLWIGLAAALLLHASILAPLWLGFDWLPRVTPPSEAIPVEIVVEPPPPPPRPQPTPAVAPSPPSPPIALEPAHDAPRTAAEAKTPRYGDAGKDAEKKAEPDQPQTGEKAASSDAAKPAAPTSERLAAAQDEGGPPPAGADAAEPPASAAAPPAQSKVATMIGQPLPTWSTAKSFSTFDPVPDVKFGGEAASPIGGGGAKTTYTSIAVGLIKAHVRLTDAVKSAAKRLQLKIAFIVDGHGEVVDRSLIQPSGSHDFDAALMEAVKEAGPFPVPPMGLPVRLILTYGGEDPDAP